MKKLLLILMASTLLLGACKKKKGDEESSLEPKQEQKGFAINYTATWCGPCGNWGAPLIHQYADDAPGGAIITVHASGDPMHNSDLYGSFRADRTTNGGIPSFWVADNFTNSNSAMTSFLSSHTDPVAAADYKYEVKDGKAKVDVKVKFFDSAQGEYYLSVLLLESGIPGGQSAPGNYQQNGTNDANYTHDFVLRASSDATNAYGELIVTDPSADQEIDKSYSIDVDSSWDSSKVYPVCIIWKRDSSNGKPYYKYINSLKKTH